MTYLIGRTAETHMNLKKIVKTWLAGLATVTATALGLGMKQRENQLLLPHGARAFEDRKSTRLNSSH